MDHTLRLLSVVLPRKRSRRLEVRALLASLALVAGLSASSDAHAAGFEKTLLWGARHMGAGGTGVVGFGGSESIFFNPAELGTVVGREASINFSPTFVQLEGPVVTASTPLKSEQQFIPIGGVSAAYRLTDKFAVGLGAYVAGGARSYFPSINFVPRLGATATLRPNIRNQLDVKEVSLGGSYEVAEGFRIGAAWRAVIVSAKIETLFLSNFLGSTPTSFNQLVVDDLSQIKLDGFRFGASYDAKTWGVGAVVRTPVKFKLEGQSSGTNNNLLNGALTPITGGTTTVENYFPLQINVGSYFDVMPSRLRVLFEYSFNRYSQNDQLNFAGAALNGGTLTSFDVAGASIRQNWRDFNIWRLGSEYRIDDLTALRVGYALTGQVAPEDSARASFSPPGMGHSFVIGAGRSFMDRKLDIDLALEYSRASGNVTSTELGVFNGTPTAALVGDYSVRALVAHLGATYRF